MEPKSLYGRHYRAVQYGVVGTGQHVTHLETFHYSDQENTANDHSSSSLSSRADVLQAKLDLENITEPRIFRRSNTALLAEEGSTTSNDKSSNENDETSSNNATRRHAARLVQPMIAKEQVEALQDSSAYYDAQPDNWETKRCRAQFEWQKATYMTCNVHHELDMTVFISSSIQNSNNNNNQHQQQDESLRLVANGYYRDVWVVANDQYDDDGAVTNVIRGRRNTTNYNTSSSGNNKIVLKTLRYEHEFDLRNWDRHRRDAIAMERLTSSRFVLDIYASCGNSGLTEYAPGGSIKNALFPPRPPKRRPRQQQQQPRETVVQQQEEAPKKPSKVERLQMGMYVKNQNAAQCEPKE
jgi:hypothetical protein